ncbi:MAG: hypothetical protein FWD13_08940 [Treponema sp.]|nr:hypothetical protein [Treponema sp.]
MVLDNLPKDPFKYSLDYQDEKPACVCESSEEIEIIEPFDGEKEALEFVNYYSQKVLNEEG